MPHVLCHSRLSYVSLECVLVRTLMLVRRSPVGI